MVPSSVAPEENEILRFESGDGKASQAQPAGRTTEWQESADAGSLGAILNVQGGGFEAPAVGGFDQIS